MSKFPGGPFWAVIFFLMLLSLGLGSMIGTLEGVITSIADLKVNVKLRKDVVSGNKFMSENSLRYTLSIFLWMLKLE